MKTYWYICVVIYSALGTLTDSRPAADTDPISRLQLKRFAEEFIYQYRHGNIELPYVSNIYDNPHHKHLNQLQIADALHNMNDGHFTQTQADSVLPKFNWKSVPCSLCKFGVSVVQDAFIFNVTEEKIIEELTSICITFKIEDRRVCESIIPLYKNEVLTVIDEVLLEPSQICGLLLGEACGDTYDPYNMWYITFPNVPKPPVKPHLLPQPTAPKLRILHLSDIHVDLAYVPGSNADCGEPLCCRADDGPPKGDPAGLWGDYRNCDTPPKTLENLFQHLVANETFDYVYWTGDLPAHNVWNQSRSDQLDHLIFLTDLLKKYLPNAVILPSLGNHESSPVDSFPPPYITGKNSIEWLYKPLKSAWLQFLPPNGSYENIDLGAYYTVLLKPGFRVVSINTNYCNRNNWWMLINATDPAHELQWLVDVLQNAEDNKEQVHIIGHIPTGECLQAWSWNYYNIVNRYESTIAGQFFGHTHHDQFSMYYDMETGTRPVSMAYLGPSVTTYSYLNPGYRIYTLDGFYSNSSFSVLDHETYIMNITAANITNKPEWKKEYSAKEEYGMKSLFPTDWSDLIERMKTDDNLFNKFYGNYKKQGIYDPCEGDCKTSLLCDLKRSRANDKEICKDLVHDFEKYTYESFRKRLC